MDEHVVQERVDHKATTVKVDPPLQPGDMYLVARTQERVTAGPDGSVTRAVLTLPAAMLPGDKLHRIGPAWITRRTS